jgi:hypothetical protein
MILLLGCIPRMFSSMMIFVNPDRNISIGSYDKFNSTTAELARNEENNIVSGTLQLINIESY